MLKKIDHLPYELKGNPSGPLVVGVHGLMGRPSEFEFLKPIYDQAQFLLIDLHTNPFALKELEEGHVNFDGYTYDDSAVRIEELLRKNFDSRPVYFLGSSFGCKIVYDFMARFPDLYRGGVFIDMGPSSIADTGFYKLFKDVLPYLDLNQPWKKAKKQLKELVPERNAQILLASQIQYPDPEGPGKWRDEVMKLEELLLYQGIDNQWPVFDQILKNKGKPNIILLAETFCSLDDLSLQKLRDSGAFSVQFVPGSTHFLYVTHAKEVCRAVLEMIQK